MRTSTEITSKQVTEDLKAWRRKEEQDIIYNLIEAGEIYTIADSGFFYLFVSPFAIDCLFKMGGDDLIDRCVGGFDWVAVFLSSRTSIVLDGFRNADKSGIDCSALGTVPRGLNSTAWLYSSSGWFVP